MKKISTVILAFLLAFALIACSTTQPKEEKKGEDKNESTATQGQKEEAPIKIGLLAPLTGNNAEYGKGFEIAVKMAFDEINAAGGVKGRKLEVIVNDTKAEAKESSDIARQYADNPEIMAIIGDFSSGASMANAPIVDEAGIVQLSPTASNPDYAGMSKYTFSIMGRQDGEGPYVAKYLLGKKLGAKKVSIIYINSDWGTAAYNAVVGEMKNQNIELAASADYIQGETDYSAVISKARAGNPDTVLILDQGAVPQIINQIAQAGWTDVRLATLGPGASEQLIKLVGKNGENLYTSTPFFFEESNEITQAWRNKFKEKSGFEPTVHPVCAYDCAYIVAKAIEAIDGEITRDKIRENIQNIEFVGISGPIKFNPAGDISRKYLMGKVVDGKWILEEGYDYAD